METLRYWSTLAPSKGSQAGYFKLMYLWATIPSMILSDSLEIDWKCGCGDFKEFAPKSILSNKRTSPSLTRGSVINASVPEVVFRLES